MCREGIPRELTWTTQTRITHDQAWYLTPDRRLDMPKMLAAFQQFFRAHSGAWIEGFSCRQAGPQRLMQACLQRIVVELKRMKKAPDAVERQGALQPIRRSTNQNPEKARMAADAL